MIIMYDVKGHLHQILDTLPQGTRLVAISKYHPNEYIMAAYEEGQRDRGASDLRNLMETLGLSLADALNALKIPPEERQTYIDMIEAE